MRCNAMQCRRLVSQGVALVVVGEDKLDMMDGWIV